MTHVITTMWIKYVIIWTVKHIPWTKKTDPVVWLSGFWTKLSRRLSLLRWPRSKIPYLFSLNCRKTVSSPSSKVLSRSLQLTMFAYPRCCTKLLCLLIQYQDQTGTIYLFLWYSDMKLQIMPCRYIEFLQFPPKLYFLELYFLLLLPLYHIFFETMGKWSLPIQKTS